MSEYRKNSLKRDSMLKLKTEIQSLFDKGYREYLDLVKIIWTFEKDHNPGNVKIFISVPKKLVNKAVNRNLVKRRIRESLRINLGELRDFCNENNIYLKIGVVYTKQSIEDFNKIEQKIVLSLQKIYSKIYESFPKS